MRTLTAFTDQARQRSYFEGITVLDLTLWRDKFSSSPTSTILRLSDATRYILGLEYLPLVKSWGRYERGVAAPGRLDIELSNRVAVGGKARFSELIRHGLNVAGTFDLAFADATLYRVPRGGVDADKVPEGRLVVEDYFGLTEEVLTLRLSGPELMLDRQDGSALFIAPPVVDGITTAQATDASATLTFAVTVAPTVDRCLVVDAGIEVPSFPADDDVLVSSVTFNGIGLTKAGHVLGPSNFARTEMWHLVNPPAVTANVVITLDAAINRGKTGAAIRLSGVHQTTPVGAFQGFTGTAFPISQVVNAQTGDLILDSLAFWFEQGSLPDATPGAAQTSLFDINTGPDRFRHEGSRRAGASPTVTQAWTMAVNRSWALGVLPIRPSAT